MKACVVSFVVDAGLVTQTVPGVVDQHGDPFVGHTLIPIDAGSSFINVVESLGSGYAVNFGVDTGAVAGAAGDADVSQFGVKICNSGQSTNRSVIQVRGYALIDPIFRVGKVTAWNLGSFDLTYDVNVPAYGPLVCIVLGGADLTVDINNQLGNGTYPTSGPAVGILNLPITGGANDSSGAYNATPGAGGGPVGVGWDTKVGVRGAAAHHVINQGGNTRQQRTDACYIYPGLGGGLPAVTSWDGSSYTITGATLGYAATQLAFSGVGIQARAGAELQPVSPGVQVIQTGLAAPQLFVIASYGAVPGTVERTDAAILTFGACDRSRQACLWAGENGTSPTVNGARLLANDSLIRFGTPAGAGTTFEGVAELVSMADDGAVTINWSVADGVARQWIWFALGDQTAPIVRTGCTVPLPSAAVSAEAGGCTVPLPPVAVD